MQKKVILIHGDLMKDTIVWYITTVYIVIACCNMIILNVEAFEGLMVGNRPQLSGVLGALWFVIWQGERKRYDQSLPKHDYILWRHIVRQTVCTCEQKQQDDHISKELSQNALQMVQNMWRTKLLTRLLSREFVYIHWWSFAWCVLWFFYK